MSHTHTPDRNIDRSIHNIRHTIEHIPYSYTWAYCIKLLPEKNSGYFNLSFFSYGKVNGKNQANLSFQILPVFFSGKSFMQWAPWTGWRLDSYINAYLWKKNVYMYMYMFRKDFNVTFSPTFVMCIHVHVHVHVYTILITDMCIYGCSILMIEVVL